ncbi:MAG: hypothetical protein EBU90_25145 [Proteobacteria bacterium]|nr:hypothetical protein [Pseudomonadota bacterium]
MSESNKNIININAKYTFKYKGMTFNLYDANTGEGLAKHEHTFPHLTVTVSGKSVIRKENVYREMDKNLPPIILKENEWHEIEALEDNTVFINIFEGEYDA